MSAADVPNLALRWAFAFPDAGEVRTKATVVGDAVLVGGPFGEVLALDAATGCVRWSARPGTPVRGAVVAGRPGVRQQRSSVAPFAHTPTAHCRHRELPWKEHRMAFNLETTGAPALARRSPVRSHLSGKSFVSSIRGTSAAPPREPSPPSTPRPATCSDHRVIPEYPGGSGHKNEAGTQLGAPSGRPGLVQPTVDAARGLRLRRHGRETPPAPPPTNSDRDSSPRHRERRWRGP